MLKRLMKLLLINLALAVLAVVIVELIFGNWIRPDHLNKLRIVRSKTTTYNIQGLYDSPSGVITYSRDKYGLRGSFKDPAEITILTLGGSVTDQRYINDGQTWQDILQQRLQSAGKHVVVANAGVDGQSTYGHIKNFEWWFPRVPRLKPAYVLLSLGLNDFYKDSDYDYELLTGRQTPLQLLENKSAILQTLRILKGLYTARATKACHDTMRSSEIEWTTAPLRLSYDRLMNKRLKAYAERLRILIARTREFGAIPILATQPSHRYRFNGGYLEGMKETMPYEGVLINGVDYYYMLRKLDGVTISVGREQGVLCLDMGEEKFWEDDDFYDRAHPTPKGAKKIGEYLFEKLNDKL